MVGHLRRTHLHKSRVRTACGLVGQYHTSTEPSEVNCERCKRTVYMADAEVAQPLPRRRRQRSVSEPNNREEQG